jgi:hypothetical protein
MLQNCNKPKDILFSAASLTCKKSGFGLAAQQTVEEIFHHL